MKFLCAASHPGLCCLLMSHKKDARLIRVNMISLFKIPCLYVMYTPLYPPHNIIVKLGFTRVYLFFLFLGRGGSKVLMSTYNLCFGHNSRSAEIQTSPKSQIKLPHRSEG